MNVQQSNTHVDSRTHRRSQRDIMYDTCVHVYMWCNNFFIFFIYFFYIYMYKCFFNPVSIHVTRMNHVNTNVVFLYTFDTCGNHHHYDQR